ncbi:MAG TPA: T9SS type A sorting domain-containing protein [Flavobacteriales bacterium]|nr:T9SS type A sorting domain-containing protein [Flavobacteriales bacterium]HIO66951.1 T9SS type A sorting domain-containing protein [Flavobacteriales bacterium]
MHNIKHLLSVMMLFLVGSATSQTWLNDQGRTDLDPVLKPFYHGVASGDPLATQVIIWTRVTPDSAVTTVNVDWRVAMDTNMTNIVTSGSTTTSDTVDFTVKVDVTGLSADTWYYYEFSALGSNSLIGRMKTSPTGDNSHVRFAVVSCSSYEHGYFNAYARISARNDVEAVLHLGDYIYEYQAGEYSGNITGRDYEPTNEIVSLADYRMRMSHYHLDHDMRLIHQRYPFINVWDDHETANNSWTGGAENHSPGTEGTWADRKSAAIQAYFEWLPIRVPDYSDLERIYRKFSYGNLIDLYMIDTRIHGRDEQVGLTSPSLQDSSRSILGQPQYDWLVGKLDSSTAQWQILGQQVVMTPLELFGNPINADQWDGYPIERQVFWNDLKSKNVDNVVVLTGDIHSSWANDLPFDSATPYDPGTGDGSVGVEFVTTSITTPGISIPGGAALIMASNQHVKYVDLDQKGYYVLDITKTKTQADWYYVSTITSVDTNEAYGESWYTNDLDGFLTGTSTPTAATGSSATLPPLTPHELLISVDELQQSAVLFGAYPNPVDNLLLAKFYLYEASPVTIKVIDILGKEVATEVLGNLTAGLFYADIDLSALAAGSYIMVLETDRESFKRKIVKN